MHCDTSLPFLGHARSTGSTVQHSEGLNLRGDGHLERRHFTVAPGYGPVTADVRESRYLESSTDDDYSVSVSELSSCPIILTSPPAPSSNLAGHLSGELDGARALGYIAGQSRALSIVCSTRATYPLCPHPDQGLSLGRLYLWLLGHAGARLRLRYEPDLCYRTVRISTEEWGRFNIWGSGQQLHRTYDVPGPHTLPSRLHLW
ncbi:hypothetical protein EDD17DRAFT_691645 [Pisolithus thermaeus]|nr:hypothetical protein EDD17DRAFT_691645 [Pisolithus thermaeus]